MNTREKGRAGENRAIEYLLSTGYSILTRNYQTRNGEIDCVAHDVDGTIVFVEVKTATSLSAGNPLGWITLGKQKKLANLAKRFIYEHQMHNKPCRFDVISIVNGKIDHIKNAFFSP
ncbi:hypothetical protein CHISP_0083 [Chitinispirillum alkaliphilum]|nr:hypothetical protein CHISP_0083 [Chitinispirillum alkaliphilum]